MILKEISAGPTAGPGASAPVVQAAVCGFMGEVARQTGTAMHRQLGDVCGARVNWTGRSDGPTDARYCLASNRHGDGARPRRRPHRRWAVDGRASRFLPRWVFDRRRDSNPVMFAKTTRADRVLPKGAAHAAHPGRVGPCSLSGRRNSARATARNVFGERVRQVDLGRFGRRARRRPLGTCLRHSWGMHLSLTERGLAPVCVRRLDVLWRRCQK